MRRYLIAGLIVWVPLGITIWVLAFLINTLDQTLLLLPESVRPDTVLGFHIPGLGVVLSAAILLLTGVIAANFAGARLISLWEALLATHPVREIDLYRREAGKRHAALRFGLRVPQGAPGRVSVSGKLDYRLSHRHAGRDGGRHPRRRARQRLRADHAQSDLGLLRDAASIATCTSST